MGNIALANAINEGKDIKVDQQRNIIITDPAEIAEIVKRDNMSIPKDEIVRIEYEYLPIKKIDLNPDNMNIGINENFPEALPKYKITNVRSYSGEYYNASTDRIFSIHVDGPDNFKYGDSEKYKCYHTAGITFNSKVSAALGWQIGQEVTRYWESNTPVKADERLHLEVFKMYYKKQFDILTEFRPGIWVDFAPNEWAYKPSSLWVKKTFTKK